VLVCGIYCAEITKQMKVVSGMGDALSHGSVTSERNVDPKKGIFPITLREFNWPLYGMEMV